MTRIMTIIIAFSFACSGMSTTHQEQLSDFTGEGLVKAIPDFISLTLTVRSECQPKPRDAQRETDAIVEKIDTFLQQFKNEKDEHFKLLVDGGYTSAYSRYENNKTLCQNTYQKSTNITVKMANRDDFDEVFLKIQTYVLDEFESTTILGEKEVPRTYVSISTPYPEITRENRTMLERQALDLAVRDAKENFKAAIKSCEPHRWKVHSMRENGGSYPQPSPVRFYARAAKSAPESESDSAAPVRFDKLEISKSVTVSFQFEGSLCFEK